MARKKKKEELLKYFDDMCLFLANHHWTKRDERAVAIRKLIQNQLVNKSKINDEILKHVNLIIEGLANLNKKPKLSKEEESTFIQILFISAFISFTNDIGIEIKQGKAKEKLGIKEE